MQPTQVWLPRRGHSVVVQHRDYMRKMLAGHGTFKHPGFLPAPVLPIDWTKGDTLLFPMDGNDKYGDCMYAAACHADQTFTGNAGKAESSFDLATLEQDYLTLAGGDNGLYEAQIVGEWKKGLCSNPLADIDDSLDIDPTDAVLTQTAMQLFGGVFFTLSLPNKWINNFDTGAVWDAPAFANPNNGHGVWWNGCDKSGRYKVQSWGTHVWITPAGVAVCDPAAFVVFSLRWFNAQGYAPNGYHYDQLATLWMQAGGKSVPPSPFPVPGPAPVPPSPPVPPTPVPVPVPIPVPPSPAAVLSPGTYIVR